MQFWMSVLKSDNNSSVACETMVKNNNVILAGEITTKLILITKNWQEVLLKDRL